MAACLLLSGLNVRTPKKGLHTDVHCACSMHTMLQQLLNTQNYLSEIPEVQTAVHSRAEANCPPLLMRCLCCVVYYELLMLRAAAAAAAAAAGYILLLER
jgi:hypothetical protein